MKHSVPTRVRALLLSLLCASPVLSQATTINTSLVSATTFAGATQIYDVVGLNVGTQFYAGVCRGLNGFDLINVTSPTTVVVASIPSTTPSAQIQDAAVGGNVIYMAQAAGVFQRWDFSAPAAPLNLGNFGAASENCFYDNGFLYVARGIYGGGGAFEIWNVTASPPALVFTYDNGANFLCRDVTVKNGRAYAFNQVSTTNFSTLIFDVSTPAAAILLGTVAGGGQAGAVYSPPGNQSTILACTTPIGAGIAQFWDVTYPAGPSIVGSYQSSSTTGARNIRIAGGRYAGVANFTDGLRIIDLANPAAPTVAGIYDPFPTNVGLPVSSGFYGVYPQSATRYYCTETVTQQGVLQGVYVVDFTPSASPFSLSLSTTGMGDLTMIVSGGIPGTPLFNLVSSTYSQPFGTGNVVGLGPDALNVFYNFNFPPFQDVVDATGGYTLIVPPGSIPPLFVVQFRSLQYGATTFDLTPIGSVIF